MDYPMFTLTTNRESRFQATELFPDLIPIAQDHHFSRLVRVANVVNSCARKPSTVHEPDTMPDEVPTMMNNSLKTLFPMAWYAYSVREIAEVLYSQLLAVDVTRERTLRWIWMTIAHSLRAESCQVALDLLFSQDRCDDDQLNGFATKTSSSNSVEDVKQMTEQTILGRRSADLLREISIIARCQSCWGERSVEAYLLLAFAGRERNEIATLISRSVRSVDRDICRISEHL